eukprot:5796093-Heterocapsa_arctica.AAC.1
MHQAEYRIPAVEFEFSDINRIPLGKLGTGQSLKRHKVALTTWRDLADVEGIGDWVIGVTASKIALLISLMHP